MTRLGNLLDFGHFLKTLATINLPKSPTFLGNFCKCVKIIIFQVKSFLSNVYRNLGIFFWSHWTCSVQISLSGWAKKRAKNWPLVRRRTNTQGQGRKRSASSVNRWWEKVALFSPKIAQIVPTHFLHKGGIIWYSPKSHQNIWAAFVGQFVAICLQQINMKKCPFSLRRWDSNPQPLECESPPITTRPGLPP